MLLLYNILLGVIFSVGFIGNLLVLVVICSLKAAHSVTNVYLINLAISDCLHLLSIPPLLHVTTVKAWLWGNLGCKIYFLLHYANWNVSIYIITAMSFDRYKAVVSPFSSARYRTKRFAVAVLVCLWLVSAAVVSPIYLGAYVDDVQIGGNGTTVPICMHAMPNSLNQSSGNALGDLLRKLASDSYYFTRYIFVTGCVLPGLLLSVFYALILRKLYLLKRSRSAGAQAQQRFEKVTVLVVAVVAFYLLCCMPHWIFVNVAVELKEPSEWVPVVTHVTTLLGYLNSAGNPVLYAFLNDPFRVSLRSIFARLFGGVGGGGGASGGTGGTGVGRGRGHGVTGAAGTVRSTSLRTPEAGMRGGKFIDGVYCCGRSGWEPVPLLDRKGGGGGCLDGVTTVNATSTVGQDDVDEAGTISHVAETAID